MRRMPHNQKGVTSTYTGSYKKPVINGYTQNDGFRIGVNRLLSTGNYEAYLTQRPSLKSSNRRHLNNQHLISRVNQRSSTSQRSSSLNEFKSIIFFTTQLGQQNYLTSRKDNLSLNNKEKDKSKDNETTRNKSYRQAMLLINSGKSQDKEIVRQSYKSESRGKICRGVAVREKIHFRDSTSADEKNFSFDSKTKYHTKDNSISKKNSNQKQLIDMVGKNLPKSFTFHQNTTSNNFFEYVMRFSYKTKVTLSLPTGISYFRKQKGYSPSNPKKINQDSLIISANINNNSWQHLFGVCDGHGPLGHLVSDFVKLTLPQCVAKVKNLSKNPLRGLNKAFDHAYDRLKRESHVDMNFSGSTVVTCYLYQNKLYCCNVGDSRAVMGRHEGGKWMTVALSDDHKPSVQAQAQRIRRCKGRVQAYRDQFGESIGPLRVWLREQNIPGLAMTRSFGDLIGASVGVSHVPQIKCKLIHYKTIEFTLTRSDKIIVIGSDGVFEFLQNAFIIEEMGRFYAKKLVQQASDHLLGLALNSWGKNSSIVDDISLVVIFMYYDQ